MNGKDLRKKLTASLKRQGFSIRASKICLPSNLSKEKIRQLHSLAVRHKVEIREPSLRKRENGLLQNIACSHEVSPSQIEPRLFEVKAGTEDELLFRYLSLHWNIPVSSGYGRRLRFLVRDESNGKVMGLIGLCDPVFSLGVRDKWIGWSSSQRSKRLQNVLDAFILGAIPPYNQLLCGKLIAMLAASNEVRLAFRRKYHGKRSLISQKQNDGRVALLTTLSALGRSSVYNRIKYRDTHLFQSLGFSQGAGDFHFANGLYKSIWEYADRYCEPTAKDSSWGSGFRNRREVVRKCLIKIGLPTGLNYHGIRREVFAVPLAHNTTEFLKGEHKRLLWHDLPAAQLANWFRERWLLPRAERIGGLALFGRHDYRLWQ